MSDDEDGGLDGPSDPPNPETEPLLDGQTIEKGTDSDSAFRRSESDE